MQHLLIFLIYLDPLNLLIWAERTRSSNKTLGSPRRQDLSHPREQRVNSTAVVPVLQISRMKPLVLQNSEKCRGHYDVAGQWDPDFECNKTSYNYCCGTCFMRYCCQDKNYKLDQNTCNNYVTPKREPSQVTTEPDPDKFKDEYDPSKDQTNTTVYISCGVIAFVIVAGVFAKITYDKATRPPREMNVSRALADILRNQGPIPVPHCERENVTAIDGIPKGNSPVRTSKNHFTPIRTTKGSHGLYGKDTSSGHGYSRGAPDLHDFISSGFVTLGRGHLKEKPRMNSILTSATEPYDLSFSRSYQSLSHLPPSYESAVKSDLSEKEIDEYYMKKRHLPDLAARGTLPLHVMKMNPEQSNYRDRPRRPVRAMSQDRVLSPEREVAQQCIMAYERNLSEEQLLSAERLQSQDPLLSPDKVMSLKRTLFREKAMSRALSQSHTDVFVSTPVLDRYKMTKMHSHPSASNNLYNTLNPNQANQTNHIVAKRHAFASRRHNTVEQLHYIPGHHHNYRTASKTEVTV
ncbi:protein shisa-6 isoform X2 [Callorhinchus milii]|uniref:protein shisa-6 isoform X2 n=1 Tax=Callorhinchus milii TaxID=7868 RepID=UPI0004573736|nr:protein shisa-6 isoform X2 [Callorhinchus milii]|eukprot:gi/632943653/ref/XP_007887064.1/ PREDICTED: protein shisa-6 homolog isoform X2 [Callorhinchus milii]